jgi:RHS repeat-associated protein
MGMFAAFRGVGFVAAMTLSASLAALTYSNTTSSSSTSAQDIPKALSPLKVEPDANEVNIATGQTAIPMPTLSIPADPNLKFDRVQNAAPYFVGKLPVTQEPDVSNGNYSIHTGEAGSESFRCEYGGYCANIMATGSTFLPYNRTFRQAGSGVTYLFSRKFVDTRDRDPVRTRVYYATKITYPNGQTIDITYATFVQSPDPLEAVLVRPTRLTSSLGYYIDISYVTNDGTSGSWGLVQQATLYRTSDPATPLARLTYNGAAITDLAGRTFECMCLNAMDAPIQTADGTLKLPGETAFAREFTSIPTNNYAAPPMIASAKRDGVTYNYNYQNVVFDSTSLSNFYNGVTVTGPNGYYRAYAIQPGVSLAPVNLIKSVTNELGAVTSYAYDGNNRLNAITYPEGNKEQITYDAFGNVSAKVTKAKPGSGLADITESAFVDTATCQGVLCYRPVWVRDGLGRQTDYVYNAAGQVTERTDPADADGVRRKTYTTYDATSGISRPTVVRVCGKGAACGTGDEIRTEYSYWGNTLLLSQERRIDAARGIILVTDYSYDAAGRLLSVDGPLAGSDDAVYYRYDIIGRKTWEIGAAGQGGVRTAKRFTYRDADDKVTNVEVGTVINPTSTSLTVLESTATSYDARRNPVRTWMQAQGSTYKVMDRSFDDRGRVECEAVRMNPAAFGSLPASACVAGTEGADGPDRITRKLYDPASQLFKTIVAVGTPDEADEVTYTYTANGKAKSVADGLGNLTTYEFDGFDRLAKTRFPDATSGTVSSTTDYEALSYDAVGNVTQRLLRDGKLINLTYDNLNRLRVKDMPSPERDITYSYDVRGGQTRVEDSGGLVVTMSYDALGRRLSEANLWTGFTFSYDAGGRRTRMTFTDGFYVTYDYHANGAMTHIRENGASSGSGVLAAYSYDGLGRMTALTRGNGVVSSYSYDPVGRLSQLSHDMGGATYDVQSNFTYNAANQILSNTRNNDVFAWNGHGNVDRNYSVNGLNQLTMAGTTGLGYDGRGNLIQSGTIGYTYDSENRLTSTASANYSYGLGYDPMGRYFWNAGATLTLLFYDGSAHVEERSGSNALLRRYIHGPGADTPLVWYEGSGTTDKRWLIPDERGSIIALTNASGAVTQVNRYDDYGIPASTNAGRFQYTGQAWVPELQMYYYKARIYAPTLGRFMQTDPTGYDDGPNWYDYVGGDPVNGVDPSGLCTGSLISNVDGSCKGSSLTGAGGVNAGLNGAGSSSGEVPGAGRAARASTVAVGVSGSAALGEGALAGAGTAAALGSTLLLCGDTAGGCSNQRDYWYLTYTMGKLGPSGIVTYSGRTAGYGSSADAVLNSRCGCHHMRTQGFGNPMVDRSIKSTATINDIFARAAIRGREQMLIEHYGGARSSGGTSGNAINGISPYNPLRSGYKSAALVAFGNDF